MMIVSKPVIVNRVILLLRFTAVFLLFAVAFSSCNKVEDFTVDYKYDYFPLEIGHYVIYDVDSFTFNDFFSPPKYDTVRYQKMHVIDSAFIDNSGREAYRITRYQRADSSQPWFIADVWHAVRTQSSLEVVEENQRFIKLAFPPVEDYTWLGNEYIQIVDGNWYLEDWEYDYTSVDAPDNINGQQFDSTLTVLQQDFETKIQKVYAEEKYAKGVGLVYKQLIAIEKQNISAPWTKPESGFILTMTYRDHGVN